uniref:Neural_ProG_Cyt domain-containing protein n=1 Tax=Heterorhabditis bacteriophora TaxID=37862 RepID=A0A1I7WEP8_HETBA
MYFQLCCPNVMLKRDVRCQSLPGCSATLVRSKFRRISTYFSCARGSHKGRTDLQDGSGDGPEENDEQWDKIPEQHIKKISGWQGSMDQCSIMTVKSVLYCKYQSLASSSGNIYRNVVCLGNKEKVLLCVVLSVSLALILLLVACIVQQFCGGSKKDERVRYSIERSQLIAKSNPCKCEAQSHRETNNELLSWEERGELKKKRTLCLTSFAPTNNLLDGLSSVVEMGDIESETFLRYSLSTPPRSTHYDFYLNNSFFSRGFFFVPCTISRSDFNVPPMGADDWNQSVHSEWDRIPLHLRLLLVHYRLQLNLQLHLFFRFHLPHTLYPLAPIADREKRPVVQTLPGIIVPPWLQQLHFSA